MIVKEKLWEQGSFDELKAGLLADELHISPLVTGIMLQRGLDTAAKMQEFLYGSQEPFHNPLLMKGMPETVERILQALRKGEKITVYGDYDVDGITATSVLFLYLKRIGALVDAYIPKRENEGYGLNDAAIKKIAAAGTSLIVTVDCGISSIGEVARAPQNVDIIISDHHTVPPEIPAAYAVVDPKQPGCEYPFKDLSGVGIAFKICQALEQVQGHGLWLELLEIVALGTVADIVPLLGENREIVRRGLKALATTTNIGLRTLIKASGCPEEAINSEHVGFILAPRLNAVGRLSHAMRAVDLLTTENPEEAEAIAEELNAANNKRKEISDQIQQEAEAMLAERETVATCIVLASPNWHPGVIGIVASRLVDKYNLPTILMSLNNGVAKGSCRSIPALNLYEAIAAEKDLLTQFGGHHQAAGLTLPEANLEEFIRRFTAYVKNALQPEDYLPRQTVNMVLEHQSHISLTDLDELELLEPFGCSNPVPVFAFPHAQLQYFRGIGKNQEHLQFTLHKGYDSYKVIMWNQAYLLPYLYEHMVADLAFVPRKNTFRDETSVQLHGMAIRQETILGDLRQSELSKEQQLEKLLSANEEQLVLFDRLPNANSKLSQLLQTTETAMLTYEHLATGVFPRTVLLYDLPWQPVADLVQLLKDKGVKQIVLLYQEHDLHYLLQELTLTHPQRQGMVFAYKLVMQSLASCGALTAAELIDNHKGQVSFNMLRVMQELKFIHLQGHLLQRCEQIKKCSLEDSPFYCQLQEERPVLEHILNENMRLYPNDILKGKRE